MEWSKIKNIIIAILLLANIFLLILVGGRWLQTRNYEKAALTRAAQVLVQNDIAISDRALENARGEELPFLTGERDMERELLVAGALLGGDTAAADQGGGLFLYTGSNGTAVFRANGDFEVSISSFDGKVYHESEADAYVRTLLESMGVEGEFCVMDTSGQVWDIRYLQTYNGVPLCSCMMDFRFEGGELVSVSGNMLLWGQDVRQTEGTRLDMSTALIRYMGDVLGRGSLTGDIENMVQGYLVTQSHGVPAALTPAWKVITEYNVYCLDGVTGEVTVID